MNVVGSCGPYVERDTSGTVRCTGNDQRAAADGIDLNQRASTNAGRNTTAIASTECDVAAAATAPWILTRQTHLW